MEIHLYNPRTMENLRPALESRLVLKSVVSKARADLRRHGADMVLRADRTARPRSGPEHHYMYVRLTIY